MLRRPERPLNEDRIDTSTKLEANGFERADPSEAKPLVQSNRSCVAAVTDNGNHLTPPYSAKWAGMTGARRILL